MYLRIEKERYNYSTVFQDSIGKYKGRYIYSPVFQDSIGKGSDDVVHEAGDVVPLPPDGGWGWVVCLASFLCMVVLDGIAYTFGFLLTPLVEHFQSDRSTVSWVGSLLCGMYMLSGPIVGGLVNRFGTRPVCIAGAILAWSSISLSTLSVNVPMLMVTYGVIGGFGLGLIYLPAVVAVGHYFESKRALATGIAVCGSGVGTFLFAPLSSWLIQNYDWKTANLIFASFFSICIICGAALKPLEISTPGETKVERLTLELPDGTVGENKNNLNQGISKIGSVPKRNELSDPSEAGELEDGIEELPIMSRMPSRRARKVSLPSGHVSMDPGRIDRNYSSVQLLSLRPMSSSMSVVSMTSLKRSQSQAKLSKPFQRKDIFFSFLPPPLFLYSSKDGVGEEFMSRGSLVNEQLKESESVISVLKSMMDFSLLKEPKFLLVSVSNLFGFLGFYVPFMYLPSLVGSNPGISENEAAFILSVIGISNTVGRILTGLLADQPWSNALTLTSLSLILSSVCVFLFPFVTTYTVFIILSSVFGLFVSAYISLTSIMLVDLVGIDQLTSSFGLVTMFRGGSAMLGPPLAGAVFEATSSFMYSFIMAAGFFLAAGIFCFAADLLRRREINQTIE
ncbi:monocarboxylate transporter 2 [Eurytemora carolleeae]|uniref:monocarboxylate transporter 2 n=1 Tax=Eurytemora carolleeae TaxID=1294199 RepID=UPI000C77D08A|nr:monocarboxylate transporter 2 [Eurytemora carolleeae]|eukprot:XP_023338137.1 monocarboxylate transporter 2-like [Eurytemora affinis]